MKILIDTQVLVWLVNGEPQLGPIAKKQLNHPSNQLFLSYFSLFEIVIKASIGKMTYDESITDDLQQMDIELLTPTNKNLGAYKIFDSNNKDPFDNMLLAVAVNEKLALMTSDNKILAADFTIPRRIDAKK